VRRDEDGRAGGTCRVLARKDAKRGVEMCIVEPRGTEADNNRVERRLVVLLLLRVGL
jgi:hypothetical protein